MPEIETKTKIILIIIAIVLIVIIGVLLYMYFAKVGLFKNKQSGGITGTDDEEEYPDDNNRNISTVADIDYMFRNSRNLTTLNIAAADESEEEREQTQHNSNYRDSNDNDDGEEEYPDDESELHNENRSSDGENNYRENEEEIYNNDFNQYDEEEEFPDDEEREQIGTLEEFTEKENREPSENLIYWYFEDRINELATNPGNLLFSLMTEAYEREYYENEITHEHILHYITNLYGYELIDTAIINMTLGFKNMNNLDNVEDLSRLFGGSNNISMAARNRPIYNKIPNCLITKITRPRAALTNENDQELLSTAKIYAIFLIYVIFIIKAHISATSNALESLDDDTLNKMIIYLQYRITKFLMENEEENILFNLPGDLINAVTTAYEG